MRLGWRIDMSLFRDNILNMTIKFDQTGQSESAE